MTPFGRFEQIVERLVAAGGDELFVHQLTRGACVLSRQVKGGVVEIVVLRAEAQGPDLPDRLRRQMMEDLTHPVDIVVVGGDEALTAALSDARPVLTTKPVGLTHVRADGAVFSERPVVVGELIGTDGAELEAHLRDVEAGPESWAALEEAAKASLARAEEQGAEFRAFAQAIRSRRPIATIGLMVLIGLVFAVQMRAGFETPALIRMGALSPRRVLDGEYWRLLSCTLLHGSPMHVGFNVYVLWVLGSFLEKVIGPARLLVLYVVSAFCGSIGSALFLGPGLSVGASGAVWGLLGAHAVLAFHTKGLIPEVMVPGARRAAMLNLGINILASFVPHVDMWAHFAGGASGALLFWALLTRGVPRLPEPGQPATLPERVSAPFALTALGLTMVALMAACLGAAVRAGQPFTLDEPPVMIRRDLTELGLSMELPDGLERVETARTDTGVELAYGDLQGDPMVLAILRPNLEPIPEAQLLDEFNTLVGELRPPAQATQRGETRSFGGDGAHGVAVDYEYPSGLIIELALELRSDRLLRVQAYRWPDFAAAPAGIAQRIVESASPL